MRSWGLYDCRLGCRAACFRHARHEPATADPTRVAQVAGLCAFRGRRDSRPSDPLLLSACQRGFYPIECYQCSRVATAEGREPGGYGLDAEQMLSTFFPACGRGANKTY